MTNSVTTQKIEIEGKEIEKSGAVQILRPNYSVAENR